MSVQDGSNERVIKAADLFCGAGGLSEGLKKACQKLEIRLDLVAINHWDRAIETHRANHPDATQYCNSIEGINPKDVVPGGHLDLLVAGIECTNISRAKTGPLNEQSRSHWYDICRWAERLTIQHIIIENVPEFIKLGPVYRECECGAGPESTKHASSCKFGRPIKEREGEYFRLFIHNLRKLDYTVQWRILRAADYGDPTTRQRFFLQARYGKNKKIEWPDATHFPADSLPLAAATSSTVHRWRPAREIIDWSLEGHSIYLSTEEAKRLKIKRPLSENTLMRIFAGLRKFSGLPFITDFSGPATGNDGQDESKVNLPPVAFRPYLVVLRNNCDAKSLDVPLPTLTTQQEHFALTTPYLIQTAHSSEGHDRRCLSVESPIPTVCTKQELGIVRPFIVGIGGPSGSMHPVSIDQPLGTILTQNHRGLVTGEAIVLGQHSCLAPRTLDEPVPTICVQGKISLTEPVLTKYHGGDPRVHSVDEPIPTIDTSNRFGLVQSELVGPHITSYYGTSSGQSVNDPLHTITTRDRHALVSCGLITADEATQLYWLDIRFRFLEPHELAKAHSYPTTYIFTGSKRDQIAQIGNSVPIELGAALCESALKLSINKPARHNRASERTLHDNTNS